ncbi:MAG TPA: RDD family protein [Bacteriovoracaceae bacterium]|nr:RDD family protein [Bacteriovoracaceae bacterium]
MKSIDLVLFADHSQKLTREMLVGTVETSDRTQLARFLAAHFIDFVIALSFTSAISQSFTASINLLLQAKVMSSTFSMYHSASFTSMIFPVVLLCYFSFFYLLNHGQTWGMHFFKGRITMKSGSLMAAAKWGCYSFSVCLTGGISLWLLQGVKLKQVFKGHDYLYTELLAHKDVPTMNLLDETLKHRTPVAAEEYKIAA